MLHVHTKFHENLPTGSGVSLAFVSMAAVLIM